MTYAQFRFLERRIKAVARDARKKPETCRAARSWLHRAVGYALSNGSPHLATLALKEEQNILSIPVA